MKRIISLLFTGIIITSLSVINISGAPDISAYAYALYCPDNSQIILSRNENLTLPMASTTKIMTALIALSQPDVNDRVVEFTEDMIAEGSSMYLKVGDKLKLSDLAAGMLAASGNDGANGIAYTLGGSIEGFSDMMNAYAVSLGMDNTSFTNPSGLPNDNHYSTAYDMALLMSSAMENESFSEVTSKTSVKVPFVFPEDYSVTYENHNRLLSLYEYCVGGKTGYTKEAGRCLVTCAKKDGITLVAVTLDDGDDWNDHIELYEYGFDSLRSINHNDSFTVSALGADKETFAVSSEYKSPVVVSSQDYENVTEEKYIRSVIFSPVRKGEKVGSIKYTLNGKVIEEIPLVANEEKIPQKQNGVYRFFRNLYYRIF